LYFFLSVVFAHHQNNGRIIRISNVPFKLKKGEKDIRQLHERMFLLYLFIARVFVHLPFCIDPRSLQPSSQLLCKAFLSQKAKGSFL